MFTAIGPKIRSAPGIYLLAVSSLVWATAVWGHGTERHFGTVINGRSVPQGASGPSLAFILLVIESHSNAILRAIETDHPSQMREHASRLSELISDLRSSSRQLDGPAHERARAATEAIAASASRIGAAAEAADGSRLPHEIAELKRLVASVQRYLRKSSEQ